MIIEQRHFLRYSIPEMEFQVYSPCTKIIGKLVNIGQKGLSFRFSPKPGYTTECDEIDIRGIGPKKFHLCGIACKRTYDISELAEGDTFTGSEIRLCGVQFTRLTKEQEENLTLLLHLYDVRPTNAS